LQRQSWDVGFCIRHCFQQSRLRRIDFVSSVYQALNIRKGTGIYHPVDIIHGISYNNSVQLEPTFTLHHPGPMYACSSHSYKEESRPHDRLFLLNYKSHTMAVTERHSGILFYTANLNDIMQSAIFTHKNSTNKGLHDD